MNSSIVYKGEKQVLVDDFMDVGYMAENVKAISTCKEKKELKRSHSDTSMTLFISFPSVEFIKEILSIDEFIYDIQVAINCYLLFDRWTQESVALEKKLKKFRIYFDESADYGLMYGTKIQSGTLADRLTKALFLVSKDGAIFHVDMPHDLDVAIDLDRLHVALNKAYVTYTGVGCHG